MFVGEPGAGKTTAALHLVAYDLLRRGAVSSYDEALREAGRRLQLSSSLEELLEYIKSFITSGDRDWLIIDDAAIDYHYVADSVTWSRLMDVFKIARAAVAQRGIIFTTAAEEFLSLRLRHAAHIYYVKRDDLPYTTRFVDDRCRVFDVDERERFVAVARVAASLVGTIDYRRWHRVRRVSRWRLAALIPVSREFAMPPDVESAHIERRVARALSAIDDAIERVRRRREKELRGRELKEGEGG
jgi:KaiC/GvpD/RAD55 family RecA-like ATPase